MRKNSLFTVAVVVVSLLGLCTSCSTDDSDVSKEVQAEDTKTVDASNTGCMTRSDYSLKKRIRTIILKKEGDIITCELQNYESNCGTSDFHVGVKSVAGKGVADSLRVFVAPVWSGNDMDCICPFNISFIVRDINSNSLYLQCWWFDGVVSFEENNTLKLEDIQTEATIGGLNYMLHETMHQALLTVSNSWEGELVIPSELRYNSKSYTVTTLYPVFVGCKTLTKVTLPPTLKYLDDDFGISSFNPFLGCSALEAIEVDKANQWLCSVDGVLYSKDMTRIISYPPASKRSTYTVPSTVKEIAHSAFNGCENLKTLYVPESEVEQFKKAFSGSVLPQTNDVQANSVYDGVWTVDQQVVDTARLEVSTDMKIRLPEDYLTKLCLSELRKAAGFYDKNYEVETSHYRDYGIFTTIDPTTIKPNGVPVTMTNEEQGFSDKGQYYHSYPKSTDEADMLNGTGFLNHLRALYFYATIGDTDYRIDLLSNNGAYTVYRVDTGLWTISIEIIGFLVTDLETNKQYKPVFGPITLYYNAKSRIN